MCTWKRALLTLRIMPTAPVARNRVILPKLEKRRLFLSFVFAVSCSMASFVEVSAATEADCIHAQNEVGGQRRSMLQIATRNSNRQAEVQGSCCPVGGPWLQLPTPNHVGKAHSCRRRGLCFMPLGLCAGHVPLQGICPSEQLLPLLWRYVACACFVLA